MKMQEKKLKRFDVYGKIANAFFGAIAIAGGVLLIGLITTEIIFIVNDINIVELLNDFFSHAGTEIVIPIERIPHGLVFAFIAYITLGMALAAYIFKSVANLFKKIVETKTPFKGITVKYLKNMGIAFFIYAGVVFVAGIVASTIVNITAGSNIIGNFQVDVKSIFYGLLLISLAEIFEYGASLQSDSESIV